MPKRSEDAPDQPTVAVLMPARNAAPHIGSALQSILAQRHAARLEVVVVDDGSTDNTAEIVHEVRRANREIRLIVQPPRGIPFARNAAVAAISPATAFVTFLDADDLSPPDRLARDLAILNDDPDLELVWGMTQPFDSGAEFERPIMSGKGTERRSQLAGLLLRRNLFDRIGGFNETLPMGEDVDFVLRMLELGPKFHLNDAIAVLYRLHPSNATRDVGLVRRTLARAFLLAVQRRRRGGAIIPGGIFRPAAFSEDVV